MALQPGRGKIEGRHYLPSTPETVTWGELPNAHSRPVLSIDPGATVTIDTVSQEGILGDQGRDPEAFLAGLGIVPAEVLADARAIAASGLPHEFGVDAPHIVTGPVFVRDAEPGDMLRVDVLSLHPRARYGIVSSRHGAGLFAGEFPEGPPPEANASARHWQRFGTVTTLCAIERRRGRLFGALTSVGGTRTRFPLAPFLGVMAVAVDSTTGAIPSTSVGLHGGALDCVDLGVGAHLYLPVQIAGGLFAVGDPHYALGDGQLGATALEGPLRATLRLSTLRDGAARAALGALREPFVETETAWVTMGVDAELPEAVRRAARSAMAFLTSRIGLERAEAMAYLSAAVQVAVGHVGPGLQTAFCRIRRADFLEPPPARSRLARQPFTRLHGVGEDADPTHPEPAHVDGPAHMDGPAHVDGPVHADAPAHRGSAVRLDPAAHHEPGPDRAAPDRTGRVPSARRDPSDGELPGGHVVPLESDEMTDGTPV
ncbi:acetamidase/formamidase family protein [Frankia sp. R82]|uniref:acetamidase/formamidase family protein n=1 Tax=Frankia sp. R82 TaxID=2950553 RepID=UPI0020449D03|nr:acetamidase/formamidase family protein [Frankia sp. R82]MCM3885850.1 acetamidase/formamidase family protein [Frankia sp. R82]